MKIGLFLEVDKHHLEWNTMSKVGDYVESVLFFLNSLKKFLSDHAIWSVYSLTSKDMP